MDEITPGTSLPLSSLESGDGDTPLDVAAVNVIPVTPLTAHDLELTEVVPSLPCMISEPSTSGLGGQKLPIPVTPHRVYFWINFFLQGFPNGLGYLKT